MNRKTLTALLGIGLIPSLLFGQFYRMDVDLQQPGQARVIDRVFTGNTVGLDVGFWDGDSAFSVTNWSMFFKYTDGQYSTNNMDTIPGTTSSNRVVFDSTTNIFYSASENYYFSIFGVDGAGRRRTFARGRLIEEYDPAASTSLGVSTGGVYIVPWGGIYGDPADNAALVKYVEDHGGGSAEDTVARAAVAGVESNLTAHAADTDNPHGVTAGQLGALTAEAAEVLLTAATNALLDLAGTRAMTGNLNMGRKSITNVSEFGLYGKRVTLHDDGSGGGKIGITRTAGGGTTERYIGYRRIDVGRFGTYTNVGDVVPSQEFAYLSDFTNYLDLAGTRAMTGNLDMGGKSIRNISTIGLPGGELGFSGNEVLYEGDSAWKYVTGTNVWMGRVGDAESSRIAALGTPGSGWTNLTITGTGNAITGATAAGDTLTLERGTIEGGGGGGTASVGVEGDALTYAFATNIALLASTNLWPQRILEITNNFTLQVPTMADTNAAGIIWLTVPSIGSYTATIPTSSPPILGYVPALATNAESELLFRWTPQAVGWRVRRIR